MGGYFLLEEPLCCFLLTAFSGILHLLRTNLETFTKFLKSKSKAEVAGKTSSNHSSWVHDLLEEYSIAPSASRVKPVEKPEDSQSKRSDTSKDNSDNFGVNSHSLRFQSFDRKFPAFFSHASVPIFNGKENRNRFNLRKT